MRMSPIGGIQSLNRFFYFFEALQMKKHKKGHKKKKSKGKYNIKLPAHV